MKWVPWGGAALGLLWFLAVGAAPTLDPTYLDWVGSGDLSQHVLGWLHFRTAPWGFPLGRTPDLMRPLVMTVGLSDSNPWVSLALKPFARWLPQDFQFVGPWLLSCFMLQGWMGAKLVGLFTPRASQRLLGAALFVTAPVLLDRTGHDTLCAQWMLVAMLYLHLRPRADRRAAGNALGWAFALNAFASGIHPYLEMMVFALTLALLVDIVRERWLSGREAAGALAALGAGVGVIFFVLGYVGQPVSSSAGGFGHYSADMLSLINPMGRSFVLPPIRTREGQYEGFGYVGTGVLLLGVAVLVGRPSAWWPRAKEAVRAHAALAGVLLLMSLLAFSSVITVAGQVVLSMRALAQPLLPLLAPFRSSGRFIWPLGYAATMGLLALTVWRWRQRPGVTTALLAVAVLVQVLDTPGRRDWGRFRDAPWPRLRAPEWTQLDASYRHIVLYPPSINQSNERCVKSAFPEDAYVRFGYLAYQRGLTTNSGYAARINERHIAQVCAALVDDVEHGRLAEDTLYVVDTPRLASFLRLGEGVTCGQLDGFAVCVSAKQGRFRDALARARTDGPPG